MIHCFSMTALERHHPLTTHSVWSLHLELNTVSVLSPSDIPGLSDDSCTLVDEWKRDHRVINAADLSGQSVEAARWSSLWLIHHVAPPTPPIPTTPHPDRDPDALSGSRLPKQLGVTMFLLCSVKNAADAVWSRGGFFASHNTRFPSPRTLCYPAHVHLWSEDRQTVRWGQGQTTQNSLNHWLRWYWPKMLAIA